MTAKGLELFLNDFPSLHSWKSNPLVRQPSKEIYKKRLEKGSFSIKEYTKLFTPLKIDAARNLRILFAHFSPFDYELEGLGLPIYASRLLPKCHVDLTYDKGYKSSECFNIHNNKIYKKHQLESKYDLIICRSSVLHNMMQRSYDKKCVEHSAYKVNIKTMSLKSNYVYANYYFEEEDMCPPADPFYLARVNQFLNCHKKQNLIVVSGTLWRVKNQLKMFEQLDPNLVKTFKIVILGPLRDRRYVDDIIKVCNHKKLDYYLLGSVAKELANNIKSLAKISIIPMDMRVSGQPKGYPRTLGESIGSKCLPLCNKPITIPSFYNNSCKVYDESLNEDFNIKLHECIQLVNTSNFIKNHNWGNSNFEVECHKTLKKCLELYDAHHHGSN